MDHTTSKVLSSAEATTAFKTQVSNCLPLLGLLSTSDKEDVWRFWKTISAAVKIAVDGKGNIMQLPKECKKALPNINMDLEKDRLQQLDQNAISIYVPLKSSKGNMLKYRVLKFADQKKVGDYFEEIKMIDSQFKKTSWSGINTKSVSESRENCSKDMYIEGLQPSISNLITAGAEDNVDDGLKSVAKHIPGTSSKAIVRETSYTAIDMAKTNPSLIVNYDKPQVLAKKIWPFERPATRSQYASIKSRPATNFCKSKNVSSLLSKNNTVSLEKMIDSQSMSETAVEPMTLCSDATIERSEPALQVTQDVDAEKMKSYNNDLEIQTNNAPKESYKGSLKGDLNSQKPQKTDIISSEKLQNQTSQPRNASDIETIISALEEELKKSGTNLSGISMSAQNKPQHIVAPLNQSNHVSHMSSLSQTGEGKSIPYSPNPVPSQVQNVSSTDMDTIHTSYLNLEASVEQHEHIGTGLENNLDAAYNGEESEQQILDASTNVSAYVEEAEQAVKLQAAPVKVTTYLDESGQPIQATTGQVMAFVNESVQPVQIMHGEEIVEVEGSIDNIIWACDGEVQILQQQHHQPHQQQVVLQDHGNNAMDMGQQSHDLVESQPVQAHYDVVEYEVLSDKRQRRGRKSKTKAENYEKQGSEQAGTNDVNNSSNDNKSTDEALDRTCPICHRVLNYASSLKAHMRIHTGARPYSCGQCNRKFTTKANRDRHEATHVGLKPFKCGVCDKSFTEKRSLKIHGRSHTGERPYVCETCGQGFAQKCTLQVHKVRHTDRRAHLCDLCGKAFRQKNQLEVHVKRHNRQAAYPCDQCETRCYTKGDLVRHMIKHTGERPFACKLCPRAFTRKQYLIDHENQHYDRKPYKCSKCGMSFHDMGSCHRHLRKHKQKDKDENTVTATRSPPKLPILNAEVVHKMLGNAKPGQILKLEDGTDAIIKQVTNDADGSAVYHITCLGFSTNTQVLSQQQEEHFQAMSADAMPFSQDVGIKVEEPGLGSDNGGGLQGADKSAIYKLGVLTQVDMGEHCETDDGNS